MRGWFVCFVVLIVITLGVFSVGVVSGKKVTEKISMTSGMRDEIGSYLNDKYDWFETDSHDFWGVLCGSEDNHVCFMANYTSHPSVGGQKMWSAEHISGSKAHVVTSPGDNCFYRGKRSDGGEVSWEGWCHKRWCFDKATWECRVTYETCDGKSCEDLGKECGEWDDGCGELVDCGDCAEGYICSSEGLCVEECIPDCAGKDCGDDGCGGSCGNCDDDKCVNHKCVEVKESVKSELECGSVFKMGDYINFTVPVGSGSVKSVDVGGEVYSVDSGDLLNDNGDVYFLHSFDSVGSIPVVVVIEDSSNGVVYNEYRNLIVYDKDNSEARYYVASCIDDPDGYFVASGSDPVKFNASSTKAIRHPPKNPEDEYHVIDNEELTFDWRFKSAVTGEEYFRCAGLAGEPCVKGAKGTKINFHRRFPVAGGNVASLTVSISDSLIDELENA